MSESNSVTDIITFSLALVLFSLITMYLPVHGQDKGDEIMLRNSTNASSLDIMLESINNTLLNEEDNVEQFRITFIDPIRDSVQRHIDFDFVILKENKEFFRLSNQTGQALFPIHSSTGWTTIPIYPEIFQGSGEYTFQVLINGISFYPIKPEEAEFKIKY